MDSRESEKKNNTNKKNGRSNDEPTSSLDMNSGRIQQTPPPPITNTNGNCLDSSSSESLTQRLKPIAINTTTNGNSEMDSAPNISQDSSPPDPHSQDSSPHSQDSSPHSPSPHDDEHNYIYTYVRDSIRSNKTTADLPSSFYTFDMGSDLQGAIGQRSIDKDHINNKDEQMPGTSNSTLTLTSSGCNLMTRNGRSIRNQAPPPPPSTTQSNVFSPDMDFLEMDFDPGGGGEEEEEDEEGDENKSRVNEPPINQGFMDIRLLQSSSIERSNNVNGPPNPSTTTKSSITSTLFTNGPPPQRSLPPEDSSTDGRPSLLNEAPSTSKNNTQTGKNDNNDEFNLNSSLHGNITKGGFQTHCKACNCVTKNLDVDSTPYTSLNNTPTPHTPHTPPPNKFSLRLVKSNTLPEIGGGGAGAAGRGFNEDDTSKQNTIQGSNTNCNDFSSVKRRTQILSYSVPEIIGPHFRAVINTVDVSGVVGEAVGAAGAVGAAVAGISEGISAGTSEGTSDGTSSSAGTKTITLEDTLSSVSIEVGSIMIWTIEDAQKKSKKQIGILSCGVTAIYNVLIAMGYNQIDPIEVNTAVRTRHRSELADLHEYLFSRSRAGSTGDNLIRGIKDLTNGRVGGKYFSVKCGIKIESFSKWILTWICRGAIPVITRNLQSGHNSYNNNNTHHDNNIPDSWLHQMVFGISPSILYLTNPIESIQIHKLIPELTSGSVLLIRRSDVICRMTPKTDLRLLARNPDKRWNDMNILGQVANMILEEIPSTTTTTPSIQIDGQQRKLCTSHIQIPSDYKAGVTLFMDKSDPSYNLMNNSDGDIW